MTGEAQEETKTPADLSGCMFNIILGLIGFAWVCVPLLLLLDAVAPALMGAIGHGDEAVELVARRGETVNLMRGFGIGLPLVGALLSGITGKRTAAWTFGGCALLSVIVVLVSL